MRKELCTFRIDLSLLDELEQYSQRNHTTVSETIRQAIFNYLAMMHRKAR
jgi:metal-responsive CopG/Arc/MetJ family transcriptional regulator